MLEFELTATQIEQFNADGFLVLDRFLSAAEVALARARFEPLFRGEFETGLYPDEWNVPIEVQAGGCVSHAGGTWHGSDVNRSSEPRRSLVSHCLSSTARFHPTEVSHIYSRYRRVDDLTMDESFFPILWRQGGYRTPFLASYAVQAARHSGPYP